MPLTKLKALKCNISRGGFSDERVFELDGEVPHSGVASRRHMWDENWQPVGDGEPPLGQTISGFVAARVVRIDEGSLQAWVSIPDGEVVVVPVHVLLDRKLVEEHVS